MKEIFLRSIVLDNFKGTSHFELELDSLMTEIHGSNGTGKTSLYDAYLWLLTGKDSKGSESFKVQPVDKNNETIPKLTTSVCCRFSIDGVEIVFKRSLYQKWSKPKGTDKEVLKGNTTDYFIDDVPVTATAFASKVKETFCDIDKLRMMSSVFQFFSLPVKEARSLLVQMAGEMPDLLTECAYPRLFKDVKETKSVEGSKVKALFAKKKDEELRVGIPLRIDENERKRPSHDFKALKAEAEKIDRRIAEIDGVLQRHADSSLFDACAELNRQLNDVRSQMEDCIRSFKKEIDDASYHHKSKLDNVNRKLYEIDVDITALERKKMTVTHEINEVDHSLSLCKDEWMRVNASEFKDTVDAVCPTCGRPFDEDEVLDKRNELIRKFNVEKVERLKEIGQKGSMFSEQKRNAEAQLLKINEDIIMLKEKMSASLKAEQQEIKEKIASIPTVENLKEASKEFMSLASKEMSLREKISAEKDKVSKSFDDSAIEDEKLTLKARLKDVLRMLGEESRIKEIEDRRRQLEQEAVDVAARIAEHDALLHEIQQYGKERINAVEEKVSGMFRLVKFQMYERNLTNDGEKEICEPLVDGVPYTGNLNYASKVNAGIDVVNAISKWLGVSMPIFIDNKESVVNTIESLGQVITLVVDPSCEKLVVM